MTVEQRLSNLENLVNTLSKKIDNNKYYTDADINGNRKSVSDITPYTESKMAYIGDTFAEFNLAKQGNISAWIEIDGVQTPCVFVAEDDKIKVEFEALEKVATVSISIQ